MYRRPKFLEVLDEIRAQMSREADYDVDLFAEMIRTREGKSPGLPAGKADTLRVQAVIVDEVSETEQGPTRIRK